MDTLFLQGKEIIEYYLRELETEGITHIPRWSPSSNTASLQQTVKATAIPTTCCSKENHEKVDSNLLETLSSSVEGRLKVHSIFLRYI